MRSAGLAKRIRSVVALSIFFPSLPVSAAPPFSGSIFMDPDIITEADTSLFENIEFRGEGERLVFDRRSNQWITLNVFLFESQFRTGRMAEVRVNKEFGSASAAEVLAEKYSQAIGRIPIVLMRSVESVTIHDGVNPFGGGNQNLLIHHGQGLLYEADRILEEVFIHEAAHTSLDADHAQTEAWRSAQNQDPEFISDYAKSFPDREDVAESFLAYLAVTHRRERVSDELLELISAAIPNRIQYFNNRNFDLYPLVPLTSVPYMSFDVDVGGIYLVWNHDFPLLFQVTESSDLIEWKKSSSPIELGVGGRVARMEIRKESLGSSRFFQLAGPISE